MNDTEIFEAIANERKRQETHIELIASENFVSSQVLQAAGSVLTNKYAEGYPSKRYYGGCEFVDVVETLAKERLQKLFKTDYAANVQPHSGSQANLVVMLACLKEGDTIVSMDLSAGGHLSHGMKKNISGRLFNIVSYGVKDDRIDYKEVEKIVKDNKPKLLIAGGSAYARTINFEKMGKIAKKYNCLFLADIAHIAGLIIANLHPSPIPHADFVTSTTHKTLRGTRGGVILSHPEWEKKINSALFPGLQGGPLMHAIAAKAVTFFEALKPSFNKYQQQILKNSKAMEKVFIEENIDMVSGGTDNHLILLDLRSCKLSGKEAEDLLSKVNITVNKNGIPNDSLPPTITSGIRIGTPAITTRGFNEEDCEKVARIISKVLKTKEVSFKEDVLKLCQKPLFQEEFL